MKKTKKIKSKRASNLKVVLVAVVGFAIVGTFMLVKSQAATTAHLYGCPISGYRTVDGYRAHYHPTVRRGSNGGCVKELQRHLNLWCTPGKLTVDGALGPKTESALKKWQYAYRDRLVVDGIAGPQTWSVMHRIIYGPDPGRGSTFTC